MATHTDYFNLEKPESYENYNIEVFNDNAGIIDLQMHNNQVSAAKVMVGATSLADGESGRVPTPHAGDEDKFLKGDGTWAEAGSSNVEANPSGTPTDTLETIGIDNVIYQLPEGGDTEITGDAEGSAIAIDDGKLNAPLKACTVEINPVQSGSGTPSPSNIRPISGWTEANVTVAGTNIWDEEWEVGAYNSSSDKAIKVVDSTHIRSKNPIRVDEGRTYYCNSASSNVHLIVADENENVLYRTTTLYNGTFTVPTNGKYVYFNMAAIYGTTYNHDISINYPSTDTSYHAYTGTTYNIEFEDSGSPLTIYGGTLDTVSGTLKITSKKVAMSSLSWVYNDTQGHELMVAYQGIDDIKNIPYSDVAKMTCTIYSPDSIDNVYAHTTNYTIAVHATLKRLWVYDSDYTDAQSFVEMLQTTNAQLVYKLTTPIEISLTPTQIITTLYGKNVIWADSGDIAITYVRDTSIAINDALNQSITPTYSSGTKIADYNVGGHTGAIYVQGAGGHKDVLWTGSETPTMSYNPTITLSHPISDYDFLLVNFNNYNGNFYLKSTVTLYGLTTGDYVAQEILPVAGAAMFAHVINDYNITLNCYGGSYENTTYVSIIGVKL